MIEQELYVFWTYDLPPYVLGAPVQKFWDDGLVEPRGFPGFHTRAIAILPGDAGRMAANALKELGGEFTVRQRELREECRRRVDEILPMRIDRSVLHNGDCTKET